MVCNVEIKLACCEYLVGQELAGQWMSKVAPSCVVNGEDGLKVVGKVETG